MASRSLGPEPQTNPRSLGAAMKQGGDSAMSQPHGLAQAMKQGSATPKADGKSQEIGSRMRQGGK